MKLTTETLLTQMGTPCHLLRFDYIVTAVLYMIFSMGFSPMRPEDINLAIPFSCKPSPERLREERNYGNESLPLRPLRQTNKRGAAP